MGKRSSSMPCRLRVPFFDSLICRNGGAFFGAAIFCRNKFQDRRALPTRGWLNNRRYVGTPASGFPLKSNNPVVGRFSYCRPFYCTVREKEEDCFFRLFQQPRQIFFSLAVVRASSAINGSLYAARDTSFSTAVGFSIFGGDAAS